MLRSPDEEHQFAVLSAFGLDGLLTEDDDPALWAAALAQHWPALSSPGGLAGTLGLPAVSLPAGFAYGPGDATILVSRPSADKDEALVYHGISGGGTGSGDTRCWVRDADGRWVRT